MTSLLGKLRILLGQRAVRQVYLLMVAMTFGAILETVGVGFILPFIAFIQDPSAAQRVPGLTTFFSLLHVDTTESQVIALAVCLGAIFLMKNLYIGALTWLQFRFVFTQQTALSRRLFEVYLRSPYWIHTSRNSSELLRNINSESTWIFHHVMIPLLGVFAECAIVVLLCALLFISAPLMSAIAFTFLGVTSTIFLGLIRQRSSSAGKKQQFHTGQMIRAVNEGLGTIKESKVYGVESYFLNRFEEHSRPYADANVFLKTASVAPRLLIESLGIGGILIACVVMVSSGTELKSYLPQLGLFTVAAVRLMPSMNRIISWLTGIRFFRSSVDAVFDDLTIGNQALEAEATEWISFQDTLELRGIVFEYGDIRVLDHVNLTIHRGESIGLVGPSGGGKSTLVSVLIGLLQPVAGLVLVDGAPLSSDRSARLRVGYIPQTVKLLDESIRRNVAFGRSDEVDDADVLRALDAAQLREFVNSLSAGLDTIIGEDGVRLSGGQRQRLGIARALYTGADILVFDEATSALDNETEQEVANAIERLQGTCTLIQIAHRLTTLRHCDQIFILDSGQIVSNGSFDELRERDEVFQSLLAVRNDLPRSDEQ